MGVCWKIQFLGECLQKTNKDFKVWFGKKEGSVFEGGTKFEKGEVGIIGGLYKRGGDADKWAHHSWHHSHVISLFFLISVSIISYFSDPLGVWAHLMSRKNNQPTHFSLRLIGQEKIEWSGWLGICRCKNQVEPLLTMTVTSGVVHPLIIILISDVYYSTCSIISQITRIIYNRI